MAPYHQGSRAGFILQYTRVCVTRYSTRWYSISTRVQSPCSDVMGQNPVSPVSLKVSVVHPTHTPHLTPHRLRPQT
jgi:hypothetical protein